MIKNVGTVDKSIRVVIGLAIITYGVLNLSLLGLIGIVPLVTAAIGLCPLYSILGIKTSCAISNESVKEA